MSLTGGFFNSKDHDRRYNAESISRLFDGIIEDGVYETYGDKFIVRQASGMDVKIGSGRAWFDHCWIHNDAKYRITIDSSEVVLDRIDTIVIDVDHSTSVRAVSFKVVRGIPASSPVAAELVNEEDHKQHPICRILVKAGATEITDANITNLVGTSECPFVIGVLKVLKADELLAQWASDYSQWKATNDNDFKKWQASEEAGFMEWLSDLRGSIDPESDVATQIITELNDIKMRHKDVTIEPSDWESCDETFNGLTYHAKKNIPVIGVTENYTACWLEITSGAALYQEALVSGLGSFTIYSEKAEEVDMHFRIWFIGKAESGNPTPTQLDKLSTKIDELSDKVGKGGRDISKEAYEALSEEDKMNGTDYYVYDDDEGEEGMQTASTIIYEDSDGSKRSVQNELDEINSNLANRVQLSLDAVAVGKDEDGDIIYEKTFKGSTISNGMVLDSNLTFSNLKWIRLVGGCFNDNGVYLEVLPYDSTTSKRYVFRIHSNSKGLVVECSNLSVKMYHFTIQYVLK